MITVIGALSLWVDILHVPDQQEAPHMNIEQDDHYIRFDAADHIGPCLIDALISAWISGP